MKYFIKCIDRTHRPASALGFEFQLGKICFQLSSTPRQLTSMSKKLYQYNIIQNFVIVAIRSLEHAINGIHE